MIPSSVFISDLPNWNYYKMILPIGTLIVFKDYDSFGIIVNIITKCESIKYYEIKWVSNRVSTSSLRKTICVEEFKDILSLNAIKAYP